MNWQQHIDKAEGALVLAEQCVALVAQGHSLINSAPEDVPPGSKMEVVDGTEQMERLAMLNTGLARAHTALAAEVRET